MATTICAVDVGNTTTTLGVFRGKRLMGTLRLPHSSNPPTSFYPTAIRRFLTSHALGRGNNARSVIASVVPKLTPVFSEILDDYLGSVPLIVSSVLQFGMRMYYDDPRTLGADRICSSIAAYEKFGGPVLVVDFGTATVYNVVSERGDFLGGAISPGIATAAVSLHRRTAQLPAVVLRFPRRPIGRSTVANIQAGVLFGALDAMEGMVRRLRMLLTKKPVVVATGGYAHLLSRRTHVIDRVEPNLVLEGARIVYERVSIQLTSSKSFS
jgi:type III pantothenate kinase